MGRKFYSLDYGSAADGDNHWQVRKNLVIERIRAFGHNLLGFQECRDDEQTEFMRGWEFLIHHCQQALYNRPTGPVRRTEKAVLLILIFPLSVRVSIVVEVSQAQPAVFAQPSPHTFFQMDAGRRRRLIRGRALHHASKV
jgi:hypothetical protein